MSKSSGSQKVIQTSAPPVWQQPYFTGGKVNGVQVPGVLPSAATAFTSGLLAPSPYPGSTVAAQSPAQIAALNGIIDRGMAGSPTETALNGYIGRTLDPNHGQQNLDALFQQVQSHVQPAVQAGFTAAGRSGSPLEAVNLADQLEQGFAPYALQAQQATAQQQATAAGMVPQASALGWNNLLQVLNAGNVQQGQGQAEVNDAVARWNALQAQPLTALQNYAGLVTKNFGNTSTTSQPLYSNPAAGALGGAATGLGIASSLGLDSSSPWNFLAGIGGGLLGLL